MRVFVALLFVALSSVVAARNLHLGLPNARFSIVLRENTRSSKKPGFISKKSGSFDVVSRGGAKGNDESCLDSDRVLAAKTALSAALETAGLLGVIRLAEAASPALTKWLEKLNIPASFFGLPVLQWISSVFVIFSSSTVKSWVKGGASAGTKQVLKPNVVPGDPNWYSNLKKPWFNPPGWLFPIMWLIVSKPTQLVAVSKILKQSPTPYWPALTVYCAHLSLGDAWNDVFFGCQRVGLGGIIISTFFGMLLASAKLFAYVDEGAGTLMLPTCGWVFVATSLNLGIYKLNWEETD